MGERAIKDMVFTMCVSVYVRCVSQCVCTMCVCGGGGALVFIQNHWVGAFLTKHLKSQIEFGAKPLITHLK